jgi:phosphatidylserine/phosphatidylglycerophosphate/cardiolipin synthase-like enzyme
MPAPRSPLRTDLPDRVPGRDLTDWYLSAAERGNAATVLDRRHPDGLAWTVGNEVRPLVHGATYFAELCAALRRTGPGDLVLFTDWRGDPDERLDGPGTEVSRLLEEAVRRGATVKGLVWRSHLDRFQFSERENRHLGEDIEAAGGQCLLDMRVRVGGSHHQKVVVLRHEAHPEWDVAYVGGIDLCYSRRDDAQHLGDPQAQLMAPAYGPWPAWHDVHLAIRGPAVGDIECCFRERWDDPHPLSRNPVHRLRDLMQREDLHARALPRQRPDPPACGEHPVQVLRTYPRGRGYPFGPAGERSVASGYLKVLSRARKLIYLEDQYLWSAEVAAPFAAALRAQPELRLIAVVPLYPDQAGISAAAEYLGRERALAVLRAAGGDRVAVYGLENELGRPVYVHAKVCVVDDAWASVGSDNLNLRSWTYDSELSCAVYHPDYARQLRVRLAAEHLDGADEAEMRDPVACFTAFGRHADALQAWYDSGRCGRRPPGRLRRYRQPEVPAWKRPAAALLYRWLFDPDGRPARLRRHHGF